MIFRARWPKIDDRQAHDEDGFPVAFWVRRYE